MANDKTKIIREAVDVFIAGTGTGHSPSSWFATGWCEANTIKLSPEQRNSVELNNHHNFKLSTKYRFEAMMLETDTTNITSLSIFDLSSSHVDILLVKLSDRSKAWKIKEVSLIWDPEFVFSDSEPRKIKLEATRTAQKIGDFFEDITGLSGF